MIDIHCHILPGIDDGPPDMASSIAMARAAVAAGITTVAATPHLRADFPNVRVDEIADRCAELRAELEREAVDLTIVEGGEVGLTWALEADDEALRLGSYGQRGTDVLIETPRFGGTMLPGLLSQVASRGYRVVLAHPERLSDFQQNPSLLEDLAARRIVLQVNADAILGPTRRSPLSRLARNLCRSGIASVVASDGHRGSEKRPIAALADVRPELASLVGEEAVVRMLELAPRAVLSGEPVPSRPMPIDEPAGRAWLPWRR